MDMSINDIDSAHVNMSVNVTDISPHPEWNPPAPYLTMAAQVFMFVLIAFVNVLTLVVLALTPKLQTIPNTYIAALAVSDLVVSLNQLIAIPWTHPELHEHFERQAGLCLFFKCLLHVNELTSILTIVLIGMDRFLYIRHPFWYLRVVTKRKVKVTVGVTWVLCVLTAIPIRLTDSSSKFPGCGTNALLYDSAVAGYVHGALFFVICSTLFLSYGVVIRTALQQARAIRATQPRFRSPVMAAVTARASLQRVPEHEQTVEARLSVKIVQKMAGVFLMLFVCWTPYVLIGLLGPHTVRPQVALMAGFLAAFNSAANFGVYALADREFRAATWRVVVCRRRRPTALQVSSLNTMSDRQSD